MAKNNLTFEVDVELKNQVELYASMMEAMEAKDNYIKLLLEENKKYQDQIRKIEELLDMSSKIDKTYLLNKIDMVKRIVEDEG